MKQPKTRICTLLSALSFLTVSLFTACGSPASSASVDSAQSTVSSPGDLRILDIGDAKGMYNTYYSYKSNHQLLSYLDYESAQQVVLCATPNCTHSDDSCTAWVPDKASIFPQILDPDHLILIQSSSDPERTCIYLSNRDGGNRQLLLPDQAEWSSIQGLHSLFRDKNLADNHYFYYVQKVLDEQLASYVLYRVPLGGGEPEALFETPQNYLLLGVQGRNLILLESTFDSPPFPEFPSDATSEEKQQLTDQYEEKVLQEGSIVDHVILHNVDTGEEEEVTSWKTANRDYGSIPSVLWAHDRIFWCTQQNTTTLHWLTLNGETGEIPITLPTAPEGSTETACSLQLAADDQLLISITYIQSDESTHSHWAALDLRSGECSIIPLYCMGNGREIPVPIHCITEDRLLIETDIDNTCTQVVAPDRDGNPAVFDAYQEQFGLISCKDFLAGLPHYRSIQMLPIV